MSKPHYKEDQEAVRTWKKSPGRPIVCRTCGRGAQQGLPIMATGPKGVNRKYYCPYHHPNAKFIK